MRIALAVFFIFASVLFAVGGFDVLNNAADFYAEAQIRFVGFSLIALAGLLPVLAIAVLFTKRT
jgi:hypothetical protein